MNLRRHTLLLVSIYSEQYPSIGESHGISVLASYVKTHMKHIIKDVIILDLAANQESDLSKIIDVIVRKQPDIIGFSVNYGAYAVLKEHYPNIKKHMHEKMLTLFGGPLATYIPLELLKTIDDKAVTIQGQGEEALCSVILKWRQNKSLCNISNISFLKEGVFKSNKRKQVNINNIPPPERQHLVEPYLNGAQIFLETSRGCHWAVCSFCLRGLLDLKGRAKEFTRFPISRIEQDLINLKSLGIKHLTFADEDFLGGSIVQIKHFIDSLCEIIHKNDIEISFHASLTVESIYSNRMSKEELDNRKKLLEKLCNAGLKKVFLGVESFSASQVKRYVKGHTPDESVKAIKIVSEIGLELEVGFIMFDPFCTKFELKENIEYILSNNLYESISFMTNILRVQVGARYLKLINDFENKYETIILDRDLDLDTLSYGYSFINSDVELLYQSIKIFEKEFSKLHYPLKNLTRFAQGRFFEHKSKEAFELLYKLREKYAFYFLQVMNNKNNEGKELLKELAISVEFFISQLPEKQRNNKIVVNLRHAAKSISRDNELAT